MAPLPVIADAYRVAFHWENVQYLRPAVNVMHFSSSTLDSAGIASAIDAHVTSAMWSQTTTASAVTQLTVTKLDGSALSYVFATGSPAKWKGPTGSGDTIPQVAVIAKLLTSLRGRSYRGRVFLPWAAEPLVAAGKFDATTAGTMQTAWNTFKAAVLGVDCVLQVASYTHATIGAVQNVIIEIPTATQRRRQSR